MIHLGGGGGGNAVARKTSARINNKKIISLSGWFVRAHKYVAALRSVDNNLHGMDIHRFTFILHKYKHVK